MINSGNDDKTFLKLLPAAAVAMFAVIPKTRPGLFNTFFAILFDTFSAFLPGFSKNSPMTSATIELSLTVTNFFLLQFEQQAK